MARRVSGEARARPQPGVGRRREPRSSTGAEPAIETSRFKRKLADPDEFVVTAEVEPPRGVDCSAAIEGRAAAEGQRRRRRQRHRQPDGAAAHVVDRRRRARSSARSASTPSSRSRRGTATSSGLQSDLLGAAGLGLKAILCLGGDPLKIGDYPQAKQVSEVDVLGLLRMAKGLNAGADLAGNAIGAPTRFAIGCAANPAAADLEVEFSKLRAKIEAGASFAQTQPVYDVEALARVPRAGGGAGDPGPHRSDSAAVAQADDVLRQRGPGHRRAAGHPGTHAPGRRARRRAREGRGPGDRAGARGRRSPGSPAESTSCRWASTRSSAEILERPAAPRRENRRQAGIPRSSASTLFPGIRQDAPGATPCRWRTMMKNTAAGPRRAAFLLAAVPPAGAQGRVKGKVTDSAGNPVEDATITVTTPNPTNFKLSSHDKKGEYGTILNDATMPYHLKFEKEGFVAVELDKKSSRRRGPSRRREADEQAPRPPAGGARRAAPQALLHATQAALAYNEGVELLTPATRRGPRRSSWRPSRRTRTCRRPGRPWRMLAYEKKDWAKTLEYGQKALDLDPSLTKLYGMMADAAEQIGRQEGGGGVAGEVRRRPTRTRPRSSTTRASRPTTRAR